MKMLFLVVKYCPYSRSYEVSTTYLKKDFSSYHAAKEYYNLAMIYYYLDKVEKVKEYGNKIIESKLPRCKHTRHSYKTEF